MLAEWGGPRAGWVGFAPCCSPTIWDGASLGRRVSELMTTLMSAFPPDLQTRSVSHLMGLRRALFLPICSSRRKGLSARRRGFRKGLNKYYGCRSQDNVTPPPFHHPPSRLPPCHLKYSNKTKALKQTPALRTIQDFSSLSPGHRHQVQNCVDITTWAPPGSLTL